MNMNDNENGTSFEEILAIYAHELRTPISAMKGYVDLIELEPEYYKVVLPKIKQNLADFNNLIEQQLLEIKFKQQQNTNEISVNLKEIITEVLLKTKEDYWNNIHIDVQKIKIPDDFTILTNKEFLKICINNYLSNAIKFTEWKKEEEIFVTLQYWIDEKENKLIIQVIDKGIWFVNDYKKLFVKHYNYGDADYKSKKWLRVWLYFVKQICDLYWWEYFWKSEWYDKGSIFWIKIPLK